MNWKLLKRFYGQIQCTDNGQMNTGQNDGEESV